jgi:hypothetical protein
MNRLYAVTILYFCLFSQPLLALRCGSWPIERGDSIDDIYDVCGEPETTSSYTEKKYTESYAACPHYRYNNASILPSNYIAMRPSNFSVTEVSVEELTYFFRRGAGIPKTTLFRFENGYLSQVQTLKRRGRHRY